MERHFNTTGICVPVKHYMVDVSKKILQISKMIDAGDYFTINRARQYGKTTMFYLLSEYLKEQYIIISISFEYADEFFKDYNVFVEGITELIDTSLEQFNIDKKIRLEFSKKITSNKPFHDFSKRITQLVKSLDKKVILMIDEVDKSTDNQIFLTFLGMLRNKYLSMQVGKDNSFHSVILAGIYDIKNLKLKLRPEEERKYNSPWNVAADFNIDMNFHTNEIVSMLTEYEKDHNTGMDIQKIAQLIYQYTSGYPFLVSKICQILDETSSLEWSPEAIRTVIKQMLAGTNILFDDLIKNLENDKEFQYFVERVIFSSELIPFRLSNPLISRGVMFGIFSEKDGFVTISNKIFEMYIYEYFISIKQPINNLYPYEYIKNNKLNMEKILSMFKQTMQKMKGNVDNFEQFIESQGRLLLVAFLTPILNGRGHYVIESWAADKTRMDLQIFYGSQKEIIELKIWHGEMQEKKAFQQLCGYMNSRNCKQGYLINFCFVNKKQYQERWIEWNGYQIYEIDI